jgi:3-deoxy-7-phosphoheptulonate synthase
MELKRGKSMILVLEKTITQEQRERLNQELLIENCIIKEIKGVEETIIGVVGKISKDIRYYETFPGVSKAIPISKPYKLVSRELHAEPSVVMVGDVAVGGDRLVVIAGPCGVEDRKRTMDIAHVVRKHGAVLFRGGAFKPRTSPYSFQGLGEEGLKILAQVREETGLGIVTEIVAPSQADLLVKYVDLLQIGARNMQNFELLKTVGRLGKPVLLKRGLANTIEEWLMAAEYILSEGNDQVILCERGIRTFETYTRNTLDLAAVPIVKKLTHLPIIIDPSHATGIREKVCPMARAGVAAGADGLIIEVHTEPEKALSDGPQSLYPEQFEQLMRDLYVIAPVIGKQVDYRYLEKASALRKPMGKSQVPAKILYHGVPGTSGHKACAQYFGIQTPMESISSYPKIFQNVMEDIACIGVVPVENSLTGSIHENYDLLLEYDVQIVGEIVLRIVHSLIGISGAKIEGIKKLYSHPQVFEQCREFLNQNPSWDLIAVKDTVTGVLRVKENNDPTEAAIANREAAELFRMSVLKEGIETNPRNFTRFVVIAREDFFTGSKDKTSIIYSVSDKPGALYQTLKIFAEKQINIVKLESRPNPSKPWQYLFYMDLEMGSEYENTQDILETLKNKTEFFKLLGNYQKGPQALT